MLYSELWFFEHISFELIGHFTFLAPLNSCLYIQANLNSCLYIQANLNLAFTFLSLLLSNYSLAPLFCF